MIRSLIKAVKRTCYYYVYDTFNDNGVTKLFNMSAVLTSFKKRQTTNKRNIYAKKKKS